MIYEVKKTNRYSEPKNESEKVVDNQLHTYLFYWMNRFWEMVLVPARQVMPWQEHASPGASEGFFLKKSHLKYMYDHLAVEL